MVKYVFVTGGVCSSLGKGLVAASLGCILEHHKKKICLIKVDPYINVDPGTMSPYQHGEVYVTDDGAETDLDLGTYSRFTSSMLSRANSITTGQVYNEVIRAEREGQYLGRTVQVVPHITNKIKRKIYECAENAGADIAIIELGGTVGDIESLPFLEAVRQIMYERPREDSLSLHLVLLPVLSNNEKKTKPAQHSVRDLRAAGIYPDALVCRSPSQLLLEERKKLSLFTSIREDSVISAHDCEDIYEIPLILHEQKLDHIVLRRLGLPTKIVALQDWKNIVEVTKNAEDSLDILFVGKYIEQSDTYMSVDQALQHGGISNKVRVNLRKVNAEEINEDTDLSELFSGVSGVIVPGGFGIRGALELIYPIEYARLNNIPFFSICLGMQMMVIEFSRNVLGLKDAQSSEFHPETNNPVISLLEEQDTAQELGGTMRLGSSKIHLLKDSVIGRAYGISEIFERHRHRYEVTQRYVDQLAGNGLRLSAKDSINEFIEAVEWKDHPWGVGVQFHPELKSKPLDPHPLYVSFIKHALQFYYENK